jgi:AcrR family transcriptional regulator
MGTRDRILEGALNLFNEAGTAAISTNHIAEAVGISPGNLYYHFRNKEAIISALFKRMFAQWDRMYTLPADRSPTLADLEQLVQATFVMLWSYRFAYRELLALLRRYPELRSRYEAVRRRCYSGVHELIAAFGAAGVLRPLDDTTVTRLADLCWLISEFWMASCELTTRSVGTTEMRRGAELVLQVLEPYRHMTAGSGAND